MLTLDDPRWAELYPVAGDSCPAALAIAPHLAEFCRGASVCRRAHCIHCIALFEVARQIALARNIAPVVPVDIETEYVATVRRLPKLVVDCLDDSWDFDVAVKLAGALIVAKGYPVEGHDVMELPAASERQAQTHRVADGEIPW